MKYWLNFFFVLFKQYFELSENYSKIGAKKAELLWKTFCNIFWGNYLFKKWEKKLFRNRDRPVAFLLGEIFFLKNGNGNTLSFFATFLMELSLKNPFSAFLGKNLINENWKIKIKKNTFKQPYFLILFLGEKFYFQKKMKTNRFRARRLIF
jgi:hypothetical protein